MSLFKTDKKEIALNNETISKLPNSITRPAYDRSKVTTGIVHFGLGNFYRAHLCVYLDRLLQAGGHDHWGITGVEVIANTVNQQKMKDYAAQNNLYTLTNFKEDGTHKAHLIGTLCDYLYAPEDGEKVLKVLTAPETKIVSLTITEGGYNIDATSGAFRLEHPDVKHDLQNPQNPKTVFGFVVEALARRRAAGLLPFTVMSCDNVMHNGKAAFKAFTSFAKARDEELAQWIEKDVAFPNSMVDRITPTLSQERKEYVNKLNGINDLVPVLAEEFLQWVLEDNFSNGRPDFDKVGVQLISGISVNGGIYASGSNPQEAGSAPVIDGFEHVKLRVLNSTHSILGTSGMLENIDYIDQTLEKKAIKDFVMAVLEKDVLPTIKAPQGVNLKQYARVTVERFTNPALGDTCSRIAGDSVSKVNVFWAETVKNALTGCTEIKRVEVMCALLLEYLRGRRCNGEVYALNEPALSPAQMEIAKNGSQDEGFSLPCFDAVRGYLTAEFKEKVNAYRGQIRSKGVFAVMTSVLS
ncbi:mannitol dehydrogenase family protein [Acetobacteraceae bacterium]|nr:mannitol dehydrogenase family protein [Acetobacteraceae bacterium]